MTAIVAASILRNGRSADDPLVAKSLKYLEGFVQADGGIYDPKSPTPELRNVRGACWAFSAANRDGRYDKLIENAEHVRQRSAMGRARRVEDRRTSTTAAPATAEPAGPTCRTPLLDRRAARPPATRPDDEAMKKALVFVSRCQNLETEHNTTPFAAKNPDGGFYYTPAASGSSPAGKTPNGGLRSYGSMTYAGLKSMIFAGVKPDDPRVKAADQVGARALRRSKKTRAWATPACTTTITCSPKRWPRSARTRSTDAEGREHDWRSELVAELASRQQARRLVGQRHALDGRRPEPGDRLRAVDAFVLPPDEQAITS